MRPYLLLRLLIGAGGFASLLGGLLICRQVVSTCKSVTFKSSEELKVLIVADGLHWHTGNKNGRVRNNFYVADRAITFDDVADVATQSDCGRTPAWRGIVWVAQLDNEDKSYRLVSAPRGIWRIWGEVIVAGDEKLIARIEAAFHSKSRSVPG